MVLTIREEFRATLVDYMINTGKFHKNRQNYHQTTKELATFKFNLKEALFEFELVTKTKGKDALLGNRKLPLQHFIGLARRCIIKLEDEKLPKIAREKQALLEERCWLNDKLRFLYLLGGNESSSSESEDDDYTDADFDNNN